jgi:predicted nucleic acid-binding protein
MEKILIDTNILIYSIDKESLYHAKSYEIVNSKQFDKYLSSKNISEFLAVTTREIPYFLSMEEVLESVDFFISNFSILYPSNYSFEIFRKLLVKYKPKGNKIHDLEIVSLAITNKIDEIKTFNEKDFKEIGEINIVRPLM